MDHQLEELKYNVDSMKDGDTKILGQALVNLQIGLTDSFAAIRNDLVESSRTTESKIAEVKHDLEAEMTSRSCNDFWSRHDEVQVAKQMIFLDEPKTTGTTDRDLEKLKNVAKARIEELIGDYKDEVGFSNFWIEFVVRYHQKSRPARRASNAGREYDTIKVFFVNQYHVDMIAAAGRKNKIDGWRIGQTITQSKMYKLAKTTVDKLNADTSHNAMYKVRNYKPVFKGYKQGVPEHLRKFEQAPTNFWPDPLCFMPSQRKDTHVGIRASIPDAPNTYHPGNQRPKDPTYSSQFALQMAGQNASRNVRSSTTPQPRTSAVRPRATLPPQYRFQSIPPTGASIHGGHVDQLTAHEAQALGVYNPRINHNPTSTGAGADSFNPSQPSQPSPTPQPFYVPAASGSTTQQYSNYRDNDVIEITNSQDSFLESSIIQRGENDNVVLKFPISKKLLESGKVPGLDLVQFENGKKRGKKKKKKQTTSAIDESNKDTLNIPDTDEQSEDEATENDTETEGKINKKKRTRTLCSGSGSSAEKPSGKKGAFDSTIGSDMEDLETESSGDENDDNDEYQTKLIQLISEHAKYDSNKRQWKLLNFDENDREYAPIVKEEILFKIEELVTLKEKVTDYSKKRRKNLTIQIVSDVKLLSFLEVGSTYDTPQNTKVLPKLAGAILQKLMDNYEVKGLEKTVEDINEIFLGKKNPPHNYMVLSTKHVKLAGHYGNGTKPKTAKSLSQKSKKVD